MIRTQVYLPEELYYAVKLEAKVRGVRFSHLVREGVKKELTSKKKRRLGKEWGKGFIGAGKTGVKTNAVRDVHVYYRRGVL